MFKITLEVTSAGRGKTARFDARRKFIQEWVTSQRAGVPLNIPSLRERRKVDIPFLANHFIRKLAPETGCSVECITDAATEKFDGISLAGQRARDGERDRA